MNHLPCFCLASTVALLHASLPQILHVVYGETAVSVGRPLGALLLFALGLQHLPSYVSTKGLQTWSIRLSLLGAFFAMMLRYLRTYLQHDVAVIDLILRRLHVNTLYTPVVASTVLECIFLGPPLAMLALDGSQMSTLWMSVLLFLPLLPVSAPNGCLFAIPLMLGLASLCLTRRKNAARCGLLCVTLVYLLWDLQTTQCQALPWLLRCPTSDSSFKVLLQSRSQTGQVSVLESIQYRVLKVDHSLLGGEWQGHAQGQSIYSTFYMQAMAIYTTARTRDTGFKTTVLLIGLGAGTSAKTILDSPVHDVLVQAAEIDCAVVAAAQQFFGLPTEDSRLTVTCEDARETVRKVKLANRRFDFISHDVFTGGDLAFPLFTLQFFQQLEEILAQGGTLSVNYVWSQKDNDLALQGLLSTLKQVFQTVEVYLENGELDEVNNLVIFCKLTDQLILDIPDSGRAPKSNLGVVAVSHLLDISLANVQREMKDWHYTLSDAKDAPVLHDSDVDSGASQRVLVSSSQVMAFRHWRFMRHLFKEPEASIWTSF